jgi:hypothetical protein
MQVPPPPEGCAAFGAGSKVYALFRDGEWYPATIEVGDGQGNFIVRWEDGDSSDRVKRAEELKKRSSADDVSNHWEAISQAANAGREWVDWAWQGVTDTVGPMVFTTCLDDESAAKRHLYRQEGPPAPPPHTIVDDSLNGLMDSGSCYTLAHSGAEKNAAPSFSPTQRLGPRHNDAFESMLGELFRLLDANASGELEEEELARLRGKVSVLRRGAGEAVCTALRAAEEWGIPSNGEALTYTAFKEYVLHVLEVVEPDVSAQEMLLQQFVRSSRQSRAPAPISHSAYGPLSTVEEGMTPVASNCTSGAVPSKLSNGEAAADGHPSRASWRSAMRIASKDRQDSDTVAMDSVHPQRSFAQRV